MGYGRFRFRFRAESRHYVYQSVDATFTRVHVVDSPIAVLRLPYAAVRQGVSRVIRIRAEVLAIAWMRESQLEQVSVLKLVTQRALQVVQGLMEAQMTDEYRYQHRVLHNIAHNAGSVKSFGAHIDRDVALHLALGT